MPRSRNTNSQGPQKRCSNIVDLHTIKPLVAILLSLAFFGKQLAKGTMSHHGNEISFSPGVCSNVCFPRGLDGLFQQGNGSACLEGGESTAQGEYEAWNSFFFGAKCPIVKYFQ